MKKLALLFCLLAWGAHAQTSNVIWSGYWQTNGSASALAVGCTFRVPFVTQAVLDPTSVAATWCGIGNSDLIQAGTTENTSGGYSGFWATCGTCIAQAIGGTVLPGDVIIVSIFCTANCATGTQTWTAQLSDCGPPGTRLSTPCVLGATGNVWNATEAGIIYASAKSVAEWITENPFNNILPNYGTVTYLSSTLNGVPVDLTAGGSVQLYVPGTTANGFTTSNASAVNATKDGFQTCFGINSTLTTCPTASSFAFPAGRF